MGTESNTVFRLKFFFFQSLTEPIQLHIMVYYIPYIGNTKASDGFRFLCFYMP